MDLVVLAHWLLPQVLLQRHQLVQFDQKSGNLLEFNIAYPQHIALAAANHRINYITLIQMQSVLDNEASGLDNPALKKIW